MTTLRARLGNAKIKSSLDAFIVAALVMGVLDAGWSVTQGTFHLWGVLLSVGLQLSVGLLLGSIAAAVARGLALIPPLRTQWIVRTIFYVATMSFLIVSTLYLQPRRIVAIATLFVLACGLGVASWKLKEKLAPSSLVQYAVGAVVACVLFLSGFEHVISFLHSTQRVNSFFILYVVAIIGAHAFSFVVGDLLSEQRAYSWLVHGSCGTVGVGLAVFPGVLYPARYPTFRTVTYLLAFQLLAFAVRGRIPRLPHFRKTTVVMAIASLAWVIALIHPLSPTNYYVAHDSLITDPFVRETGILRFATRRYVSSLPDLPSAAIARPNIVEPPATRTYESVILLTIDTLRYDHVGYSGKAAAGLTPALDRLASTSQRFHRAYSPAAGTSLTVPALLWGKYPKDLALIEIPKVMRSPRNEPTQNIAEMLNPAGVHTIAIMNDGHTAVLGPERGFTRGFAEVLYPDSLLNKPMSWGKTYTESSDAFAVDLAIDAIARLGDKRFFMWLHLFEPHGPYGDPDHQFTGYDADVHRADAQVGRLLDELQRTGRLERTLIVLTSDHGEELGERGNTGHGLTVFEETIRVPLLVHIPGLAAADYLNEVETLDIVPTILTYLGAELPTRLRSRPHLLKRSPEQPAYTEMYRYRGRTMVKQMHQITVILQRKKVIYDLRRGTLSVFDLEADPGERSPIFQDDTRHGPWVDQMIHMLFNWHASRNP